MARALRLALVALVALALVGCGSSGKKADPAAFCQDTRKASALGVEIQGLPLDDPGLRATLTKAAQQARAAADASPDSLRADVRTLTRDVSDFARQAARTHDPTALGSAFSRYRARTRQHQAQAQRVKAWIDRHCPADKGAG